MKKALFALCTVMAFAGCGPKLTLWRVSFLPGTSVCTPAPKVAPATTVTDSDSYQIDGGVWEIWEGPGDKVYLQGPSIGSGLGGAQVIEGTFASNVYTFATTVTTVQKQGPADAPTETVTGLVDNKFNLTVKSDTIDGTWTRSTTNTCAGSGCPATFTDQTPNCTQDAKVKGRRLDADNQHQI